MSPPKLAAAEAIGPDPDKVVVVRDSRSDLNRNEKNSELADALNTTLNDLDIVQIDRLEIGVKGWRVTYR
jgi:hypothetical protein